MKIHFVNGHEVATKPVEPGVLYESLRDRNTITSAIRAGLVYSCVYVRRGGH